MFRTIGNRLFKTTLSKSGSTVNNASPKNLNTSTEAQDRLANKTSIGLGTFPMTAGLSAFFGSGPFIVGFWAGRNYERKSQQSSAAPKIEIIKPFSY